VPWFPFTGTVPLTYNFINVGHIVNCWSQADFTITMSIPAGMQVYSSGFPVYSTIPEAISLIGPVITSSAWGKCSTAIQQSSMLVTASQYLMSICKFPMVQSQFLDERRAYGTNGFHLDFYPVQSHDGLWRYEPGYAALINFNLINVGDYFEYLVEADGNVTFSDWVSDRSGVLKKGNLLKMTYQAGLDYIPEMLLVEMFNILKYVKLPVGYESIKSGSVSTKLKDDDKTRQAIVARLKGLFEIN
jgi:hypothetical protein